MGSELFIVVFCMIYLIMVLSVQTLVLHVGVFYDNKRTLGMQQNCLTSYILCRWFQQRQQSE